MPKKTAAEYEAMIGGLMHRIETLEDQRASAIVNAEGWQARAEAAEKKQDPRLVIDWESMCKDRGKVIEDLEIALRNTYEALKEPGFVRCTRCGWQEPTSDMDVMSLYIKPALGIE